MPTPPTSTPWVPMWPVAPSIPAPVNEKWLKTVGGAMVWADATIRTIHNVSAANTDLPVPTAPVQIYHCAPGGGTVRSMGAPVAPTSGQRAIIRNAEGTAAFTVKHNLAGGAGVVFVLRGNTDLVLQAQESVEFMYDGAWREIGRNVAVSAILASKGTTVLAGNSVAEVEMMSGTVPANYLATVGRAVRMTMVGEFQRNAGHNLLFKVYWGGGVQCQMQFTFNGETNAEYQPFKLIALLSASDSWDFQFIEAEMVARRVGAGKSATTGQGGEQSAINVAHMSNRTNVNSGVDQIFKFNVQWTGADGSCNWRQRYAVMELL